VFVGRRVKMDSSAIAHVTEMFGYHATDGFLDERSFGQLLQEGLAYSFLDVSAVSAEVKGDIRCACSRMVLPGHASPLFARVFQFFDYSDEGKLTLDKLIAGLEQFLFGSWSDKLQFLFYLTDLNDDGLLSTSEMEDFLQEFRVFYYSMAHAVFVMLQGSKGFGRSDPQLDERIDVTCCLLAETPRIVSNECARKLHELDTNNDGYVSEEEWQAAEFSLPVAYGVLLASFVGIADNSRIGQFFEKVSIEEPIPEPAEPIVEVPLELEPERRPFTLEDLRNFSSFKKAAQSF